MKKNKFRIICVTALCCLVSSARGEEKKLTIETAVQAALANNERAVAADERVKVSDALLMKARSFFLPTISASGTYTRRPYEVERTINDQTAVIQSLNAKSGTLSAEMNLFDSRSLPLLRQARYENRAEKSNSLDSKRGLSFEVCNAYLVTLGLEQLVKAAQQRFDLAGKNLEASKARFEAQLVSVNDVTRTELEYATAEMNLTRAQGDAENARLQLEFLLGVRVEGELENPENLLAEAEAPPPPVQEMVPRARQGRLDLRALQWQAKAQHSAAQEPLMRWLPALGLSGQYRITNESGFSGRKTNWSISLTVDWALFDGLTRFADYKQQKALAHIADLNFQAANRQVEVQVRSSRVTLTNQQASLKQAAVALAAARKNAVETAELFRQGLTGALQAADANVSLYETEVEFIRARYGLAIAFMNLRLALGQDPFGPSQSQNQTIAISGSTIPRS